MVKSLFGHEIFAGEGMTDWIIDTINISEDVFKIRHDLSKPAKYIYIIVRGRLNNSDDSLSNANSNLIVRANSNLIDYPIFYVRPEAYIYTAFTMINIFAENGIFTKISGTMTYPVNWSVANSLRTYNIHTPSDPWHVDLSDVQNIEIEPYDKTHLIKRGAIVYVVYR